ncbi:MAG: aminotransferase class IV [Bacteroidales bacterium]|nr:aminotransferase class IV [Bacteroidales bacterium]
MKNNYIILNGELIPRQALPLTPDQWIQWGEHTISLTLLASGNRIPLLSYHHDLLSKQFDSVGWIIPAKLDLDEIKEQFEKLLNKNRSLKGSRIDWIIKPSLPAEPFAGLTDFSYLAINEETSFDHFPLNRTGLSIGLSEQYHNSGEPFYQSMIRSRTRELLIRQEGLLNGWDEVILPDPANCLSESADGNIFLRRDDRIFTPAPENYPLPRVMYQVVKEICEDAGIRVEESALLTEKDLLAADEIFITDDLHGIRWVMSFQDKRYYRKTAAYLSDLLRLRLQEAGQFQRGFSG